MVSPPRLTVVIPAYDEALRLGSTLERVLGYLDRRGEPFELLVVDDGSRDETAAVARAFEPRGAVLLRQPSNAGKGKAVRVGLLASRGDRILITDADLSTPIEELDRLLPVLERADLVLGSRAVDGARLELRQPFYRELAGKGFNLLVRLSGVRGIRDTQCGFKLFDGPLARSLARELTVDRFAWDVELVWLAQRRGLRVVEIGVEWRNDPASRVRFFRDATRMAFDLARFRWRHRAGRRRAAS